MRIILLKPHPAGYDADAACILAFTIARECVPILVPYEGSADRYDRAIARCIWLTARHADEHAPTLARIVEAKRRLVTTREAMRKNEAHAPAPHATGAPTSRFRTPTDSNPTHDAPKTDPKGPRPADALPTPTPAAPRPAFNF